jgi:Protein of unknown function (DUF3301)
MQDLLALTALAAAVAGIFKLWQLTLGARETANRLAKEACERAGVQFLDGTAAFSSWTHRRGADGKRSWLRTYTFDYSSDGTGRAQGFVVLSGERLEYLGLADTAQ